MLKEAKEGTINLPEDEPAIIRLLIAYIYKGKYEPALQDPQAPTIVSSTEKEKNRRHALLEIAFTFPHTCHAESADSGPMIHRCKLLLCSHHACSINCSNSCKGFTCSKCIRDLPDDEPSNHLLTHAKMYEIADKYDVAGLKDLVTENFRNACKNFWSSPTFAIAAYYAFSTTPDSDKGLRDIVVKTIADHMAELVKKPEIENLLTEFNGLALGLLKAKTKASWW